MKSPIFGGLYKYAKMQRIPFNAPGHKGRVTMRTRSLSRLDLYGSTKDGDALNLRELTAKSEDEITKKYGTCRSMYLRNGATSGIYAMLAAYTKHGDKVIIDRECHRSVINALIIQGLEPIFVKRNYNYQYSITESMDADAIERAIISNRDAKAVLITSPTYYGIISDIRAISAVCRKYGVKLLVDEALGAHFGFSKVLPQPAAKLGADISVHSVHKSLGAFGGGSIMHIADPDIDFQRITDIARMYESSSASPALLCTLENAVYYAFENSERFTTAIAETEKCRKFISENTPFRWFNTELNDKEGIYGTDPLRMVLNLTHVKADGYYVADYLRNKADIEVESASENNVVFLVSIYNSRHEIRKLFQSLATLAKTIEEKKVVVNDVEEHTLPEDLDMRLTPEKAFNSSSEFVTAEYSLDRVSKRTIYRMPDEVPIVLPGEKIKQYHLLEISKIIASGGTVKGLGPDNTLEVVTLTESFGL